MITPVSEGDLQHLERAAYDVRCTVTYVAVLAELRALRRVADAAEKYLESKPCWRDTEAVLRAALRDAGRLP